METPKVHPSQRRVACELCRKHKARCQRFHQSDPSCARCTLYGVKCTNGRQKKVGRPRPAKAANSAVGGTRSATYIPPTPPSTSPDENSIVDMSTYQMNWADLTSSNPGPLQIIGKTVDHPLGDSAPTWSPTSVDNNPSPWNTAFDLTESASMFAYNSIFGTSPPITDTDASPLCLLQSPPSTVFRDPHVGLDIPKQCDKSTIDDQTALMKLSKINIDLHARVSAAKSNNAHLNFDDLVYRQGPLYIDNYTLAEFILNISQSFLQIITRVLSTRTGPDFLPAAPITDNWISELMSPSHQSKSHQTNHVISPSHSPPSYHAGLTEPLSAPLALMITSIFIQLLSLYELILEHTTTRVDRLPIDPIPPIPILPYDTLVLESLCTQGAFFSRAVVHVLERMQYVLGIESGPGAGQKGLLTAKQIKVLWGELDSGRAIIPGQAVMGPDILRRLYGKMEIVLERIAADTRGSSCP